MKIQCKVLRMEANATTMPPPTTGRPDNVSSLMPPPSTKPPLHGKNNIVPGRVSGVSILGGGRRPWWNLCFVHGDQTKYYRQLYGKRTQIRRLQHLKTQKTEQDDKCAKCGESFETSGQLQ